MPQHSWCQPETDSGIPEGRLLPWQCRVDRNQGACEILWKSLIPPIFQSQWFPWKLNSRKQRDLYLDCTMDFKNLDWRGTAWKIAGFEIPLCSWWVMVKYLTGRLWKWTEPSYRIHTYNFTTFRVQKKAFHLTEVAVEELKRGSLWTRFPSLPQRFDTTKILLAYLNINLR